MPQPTPREFFFQILADWAKEVFSPPPLLEEVCFDVQLDIQGEGGLSCKLTFDLGDYSAKETRSSDPLLAVRSTRQQWDLALPLWYDRVCKEIEEAGGPEEYINKLIAYEEKKNGKLPRLTEAKLQALRQTPIVFEAILEGTPHGNLSLKAGLWTQQLDRNPEFILRTDYTTARAMQERKLHPLEAWKQKKVAIDGNLALALKIGGILQKDL